MHTHKVTKAVILCRVKHTWLILPSASLPNLGYIHLVMFMILCSASIRSDPQFRRHCRRIVVYLRDLSEFVDGMQAEVFIFMLETSLLILVDGVFELCGDLRVRASAPLSNTDKVQLTSTVWDHCCTVRDLIVLQAPWPLEHFLYFFFFMHMDGLYMINNWFLIKPGFALPGTSTWPWNRTSFFTRSQCKSYQK